MEYGNMLYMGAAPSTLKILDSIQESAMKIGGFEIESLSSRREAAAAAFALRLLDGNCRGVLQDFTPTLETISNPQAFEDESIGNRVSRHHFRESIGLQIKKSAVLGSLQRYERCFFWCSATHMEQDTTMDNTTRPTQRMENNHKQV